MKHQISVIIALLVASTLAFANPETGSTAPSDKQAMAMLIQDAQQGNAYAQYNLAYKYSVGQGVAKDQKQAAEWYEKSAEQGMTEAQIKMGELYAEGLGVEKNNKLAVEWYTRASEQGHLIAQYKLGQMYEKGMGVSMDMAIAHAWYTVAASNGNAQAKASRDAMASRMKPEDIKKAEQIAAEIKEKISAAKKQK